MMYLGSLPLFGMVTYFSGGNTFIKLKFVTWIELTVLYLSQTILVILYNPHIPCNKSFPFHGQVQETMRNNKRRGTPGVTSSTTIEGVGGGSGADIKNKDKRLIRMDADRLEVEGRRLYKCLRVTT